MTEDVGEPNAQVAESVEPEKAEEQVKDQDDRRRKRKKVAIPVVSGASRLFL
jgi:hypothetical protein